ncbi:MAG: DMT family transporter [Bacilli bacterium]
MKIEHYLKSKTALVLSALCVTFLWGSAVPLMKVMYDMLGVMPNDTGEQLLFAGYRFTLSGLLILLLLRITGGREMLRLPRVSIAPAMLLGVFQTGLQYTFFSIGIANSTGMEGAIIAGTGTFFQILYARLFIAGSVMRSSQWLGLGIGFFGVLLINIPIGKDTTIDIGIGEVLLLCSVMSAAFGNVYAKMKGGAHNLTQLTGYGMLFGGSALMCIGVVWSGLMPWTITGTEVLLYLYLATLSAIGFLVWNLLMSIHEVTSVSVFMFLIPVFGVLLSGIILHEPLTIQTIVGLVAVALGILIVNGWSFQKKRLAIISR